MPTSSVDVGPVEVFRDARAIIAESPFWLDGALQWCDITAGLVHVSPSDGPVDGSADTVVAFPAPVGSFQPAAGGGWVLALGDRIVLGDAPADAPRTPDGELVGRVTRELAPIHHRHPGLRMNEGKCDPQGRFVAGSMDVTTGEADGAFYLVDSDGARVLVAGIAVANGLEWSLDESHVYFTDTAVGVVYRAPWDPVTGAGEPAEFATGSPSDGLTIDADGCFWNARNGEGCVVRLDPDGREVLRIDIPAPNVTGVIFGGDDLSTLFVGSAREKMTEEQLEDQPLSGGIFRIETSTHGFPVREYRA